MRIFTNPNYNFIRWRWHAIILSVAIIGSGLFTIVSRGGLPLGVDFSGGTVLWLKFKQPISEDAVRNALGPLSADATVQTFGNPGDNEIMIRLPLRQGLEQGASLEADAKQVEASVRAANIGEFDVRNREIVGPTIGEDLKRKGVAATLTALGGILVYIALRFRLSFGVGAIVATFHDILVTLVFLTWFGYELSLNVIAAILTITGYSVNDTIVIFDRVRENQRLARKEPLDQTVNRAVNQTLSRTVITAGATFLAVLALYLFGGEVLRPMAFTLLVGIVTGTNSTVFIASAVANIMSRRGGPPATLAQAQAKTKTKARRPA
jgi:preprotein translocase subunit SecF